MLGSPEQEAVGELKEPHLMPATARVHGVTQQDSAEVGIHGIRERLQFFVEESPGARNKGVRVWLPKIHTYIHTYIYIYICTQAPPSPDLRVPGLLFLFG